MDGLLTEMRIAMFVCVYYSLDHYFPNMEWVAHLFSRQWELDFQCLYVYIIPLITYFPKHGGGCSQKWELQCLYVYIIPLITYFPDMEGVAHRNENCNVCMCILFLWSPISPTWSGCWEKWELQCLYVYIIPLITYFHKHGGGCSQKWELQCLYVYIIPFINYFHNMDSQLTEMRIAMFVCVYYSLDHLFSRHGWGCSQKWELQCLYVYIIPLITYFPNMEGVAERNENCNVCVCILLLWSPISPTSEGVAHRNENCNVLYVYIIPLVTYFPKHGGGCSQKWELQCMYMYIIPLILFPQHGGLAHRNENCCIYVYYSLDHLFPQHGGGCSQKWGLQCLYVYIIPLITYFTKHGGGCSQKWELQCLYVYIIPLITYFPNMDGLLTAMRIPMYICILFPWSPIFPTWRGLLREMRIAMSVCVYYSFDHLFPQTWMGLLTEMRIAMSVCVYYSFDHLFPQHGGACWEKWELQCLYVYIIPFITYFPKHGGGCSQKWELQCLYVYIIPFINYFHNMEGVAYRNENCNVCMCILFPWSPIFPTWRGLLRELRIAMSVCVYYSIDHLFSRHGWGCSQKLELRCLYVYIIRWLPIFQTWRGMLREVRIPMSVYAYYSLYHLFPQTWRGSLT